MKELFAQRFDTHVPGKKDHVFSHLKQNRGRELNDSTFGAPMTGLGPLAQLLSKRYQRACGELKIDTARTGELGLDCGRFQPPPNASDQMALF